MARGCNMRLMPVVLTQPDELIGFSANTLYAKKYLALLQLINTIAIKFPS
jgi:hypothetical protein